jgi:hypothetical protein
MIVATEKFQGRTKFDDEFLSRLDRNFDRLNRRRKIAVTVVSTSYTIVETDELVVYTGTGGHTITLPHATAYDGYSFTVKHAGTGVLTLDATSKGQLMTNLGLVNTTTLTIGDGVDLDAGNNSWQVT